MYRVAFILMAAAIAFAQDNAVIIDSGSTNTAAYRIAVERSGKTAYSQIPRKAGRSPDARPIRKNADVGGALVARFYADLEAARPFSSLPRRGCMKSASFGTTLTVTFGDETTPDLSCGSNGNSKMEALIDDVRAITKTFESQP
jgi:hypothetical protein